MTDTYANKFLTLKSLDRLLSQHQKNTDLYVVLYGKKIKLLQNIQNKKIDAKQYAAICQKLLKEQPNEDIRTFIDMEITLLMEGEQQQWFNDVLQETKEQLANQKQLYDKFSKKQAGNTKSIKKSVECNQQKKVQSKNTSSSSQKPSNKIQIQKIFSFKLLDDMMENAQSEQFLKLFQQKEKLIKLMEQRKLVDKVYLGAVKRMIQQGPSYGIGEDEMFALKMDYDLLEDLHDGNVAQWFEDVVNATGQCYQDQQNKANSIKNGGKKTIPKKKSIEQDDELITQSYMGKQSLTQSFKKKQVPLSHSVEPPPSASKTEPKSQYICFRYLEQRIKNSESNPQKFCQLFKQKLEIIQKMKNGKLSPQSYRDNLTKLIQQSKNDEEKQAAQTQLDFHDLTGDVNDFFQSTVDQFGQNFQEQEQLYKKLSKNVIPVSTKKYAERSPSAMYEDLKNQKKLQKQAPKPDISDIVSFKAIVILLTEFKKDYDYCLQLKTKGKKLYALVEAKKLGPNQYKQFLISKISSVQDKKLLQIMKKQLKEYQKASNIGKLFKQSVKQYLDKVKIDLGKRKSYDEQFTVDQTEINQLSKDIQIQFLVRKLAKYQSLLAYFRNNQLDKKYEDFKKQYQSIKSDILMLCEKLKDGAVVTKPNDSAIHEDNTSKQQFIDLKQYVEYHLPDITFGMFHRVPKSQYIEQINTLINSLKESARDYLQYTKKIKKSTNKKNIEQANKYKEDIISEIQYLQSIKNKDFVPIPTYEIKKEDMYNLDLNKHLSENDIEININSLEGIPGKQCILRIFMVNMKEHRYKANVKNGLNNIQTIVTIPPQIMEQIIKGTDKKYLLLKFSSKGWFGESEIDEVSVQFNFIKTNVMEETIATKQGKINVGLTAKVYKPKKPIITPVKMVRITKKHIEYKHSKHVENQFLKSLMPFEKPSQSEIVS